MSGRALAELRGFEAAFPPKSVLGVYEFAVEGAARRGEVSLQFVCGRKLIKAARRKKQPQAQDDEEAAEDSMEESMQDDGASAESSGVSVDTDAESEHSASPSSEAQPHRSDDDADMDEEEQPQQRVRSLKPELWPNKYVYIIDNAGQMDVKVRMYDIWTKPEHMGRHQMSKTLTPLHYEETRADPLRSVALLRAWMLWRARADGWASERPGPREEFQRDADALVVEVRSLPGDLLGNSKADAKLRTWAPDVVERIMS